MIEYIISNKKSKNYSNKSLTIILKILNNSNLTQNQTEYLTNRFDNSLNNIKEDILKISDILKYTFIFEHVSFSEIRHILEEHY